MTLLATLPPYERFAADVLGLDMSTRAAHVVIHKAIDGRPLSDDELVLFQTYTGRSTYSPPVGGWRQLVTLSGRQGGKTENAAGRLAYEGVAAVLRGDRDVTCIGVSQDARAAQRVLFGYVLRFFGSPLLAPLVLSQTANSITLRGNVVVMVLPCRPAALRGLRCIVVVLDEVAHYRSSENYPLDREVWRAALPTLLTTSGRLLALSSPHGASGLLYDLHRAHYGKNDSQVLIWQSPGTVLHPGLDAGFLAHLREVDPESARAELDAEFLTALSALFDADQIETCVSKGVHERLRMLNVRHVGGFDASSGRQDPAGLGIAHPDPDGVHVVLDVVRTWNPPFSPDQVIAEAAAVFRSYGIQEVVGDRFAGNFVTDGFKRAGLQYVNADRDRSGWYLDLAGLINSERAVLLDEPRLLRELRGLERRRLSNGRDRVDHRSGKGAHDDAANAAAIALVSAAKRPFVPHTMKILGF